MPPKRKASASFKHVPTKQSKPNDEKLSLKKKLSDLKKIDTKKVHKVDKYFPVDANTTCSIHEEYDCTLNQTDIGNNNNKFYIIQLIVLSRASTEYAVWTRWGRVGDVGQSAKLGPFNDLDKAIQCFEKKFSDKTANKWNNRGNFTFRPGKYSLVDVIETGESDNLPVEQQPVDFEDTLPSSLDEATQDLIKRIFSKENMEYTMRELNLDVKKMPLGKLSGKQIASAFEVLDQLEKVLENQESGDISFLSSRFYTIIPHNFGRTRPPLIDDLVKLRGKMDMLNTLSDIALGQSLQKEANAQKSKKNALDEKYNMLCCDLNPLYDSDADLGLIQQYFDVSGADGYEIIRAWRLNRHGEDERFRPHLKMSNHKLLWHGTSVAVVAAILKAGLRIMPHSGGLVGKGLYFASAAAKSQHYGASDTDGFRIMFLVEVALGKEHHILKSDCSIRKAPSGFDSVVALGNMEPDHKKPKTIKFEGPAVQVLCSKPENRDLKSNFYYSEYLIYDESQCRLRFLILYRYKQMQ